MKPEVIDISDDEGSGAAAGGSDGSGPGIFSAIAVALVHHKVPALCKRALDVTW